MLSSEEPSPVSLIPKREELFGLDLRSLAVFRIGLALIIIIDIIDRFRDLKAHYTDFGILPRAALIENFLNRWQWSVHLFSGEAAFQGILFLFAIVAALALLIGYRTRVATILSWILLVSLHARNPVILNAGDIELRLLLFWGIFLPLDACYSVDSALNSSSKPLPERFFSGATIALTLQICFIYWFTGILKSNPVWWLEGSAVYYALSIDQLVTPFGRFLLNFPPLLVFSTFVTLWIELLGPLFLFVPVWTDVFRLGTIATFILLHIGFRLGLVLGLFPYVCIVAWLVFLPSSFWNWASQRLKTPQNQGLRIYYDGECGFCKKMAYLVRTFFLLPETPLLPAQDEPEIFAEMQARNSWVVVDWQGFKHFKFEAIAYLCHLSPLWRFFSPILKWQPIMSLGTKTYDKIAKNRRIAAKFTANLKFRPLQVRSSPYATIATLFLFVCVFLWNLNTLNPAVFKLPKIVNGISLVLKLDQQWSMFAPYPLQEDGWYVVPGKLKDGTEVDLFKNGASVSWEKPSLVSATYPNEHWRKYMMNLWSKDYAAHRLYYAQYLCRNWNSQHQGSKQLDNFQINFMLERTLPNYQPSQVEKVTLWEHFCFEKPKGNK